ncbi:hypothetical protein C0992_013336 [Termitomyces sp. T32_za158]|nr:hypothetical protein C0992_013336 [Termitomyces sp. T32_za158]
MLEIGALYIALYARDDPSSFHWAIYHHWSSTKGTKFHIRNIVPGQGWFSEHKPNIGIMKEFLLVGLMKIADVPADLTEALHTSITAVPYDGPNVNCLSWVKDALEAAMSAGAIGRFSIDEMEQEAQAFGSSQYDDASQNVQPRPITTFKDAVDIVSKD